ncbi:hypothetical protein Acr_13g0005310 [Actinidia rufa]|uniref:Uncharacterized protein n=1 Tax=Actinidia rufa TaxID=165716 RepID=A0A7J0FKB5_9ERIC|nr:hypothetical protein Acr_13g0005310 [Actinidia rufa]
MVLLRAQRALIDLTESGLELALLAEPRKSCLVCGLIWLDVTGDWSLGTTIGIRAKFESPESHRSDFGDERKPISNSDQIRSAQKWRLSIPPDSSRRSSSTKPQKALSEFSRRSGFIREHDETSAHGLWTKLEEMYREKTSQKQSLIEEACVEASVRDYSGGTNERVPESHRKRSKEEAREEVSRRRSQRSREEVKEEIPTDDGGGQNPESSEAATTAMMAVDESDVLLAASADEESDWISDSGIAYHLCRDKEVFSIHVACEDLFGWLTTRLLAKDSPVPHGRREIHEGDRGKQEKLQEKKDWKAIPTEGECPDRRAAVRHSSSGISKMDGRKKQPLHKRHAKQRREYLMDDVHEEAQRRETESMHNDRRDVAETSLFRSRSVAVISPVVHTREERWSHDDLPKRRTLHAPRSYRRAGPEVVGKDNLKTSDYAPMGWRGRLLEGAEREGLWECYGAIESTESTDRSDESGLELVLPWAQQVLHARRRELQRAELGLVDIDSPKQFELDLIALTGQEDQHKQP